MAETFRLVEDSGESLDSFIVLLDRAGEWLWRKGVKQWEPGSHRRSRDKIRHQVENGCLVAAYEQEALAGGCVLTEVIPSVWTDPPDNAMYVCTLAVARFAAGKGLGGQILDYCAGIARNRGKSCIRLDCWDGNAFLKTYYQNEGFEMLEAVQVGEFFCRLFERELTADGTLFAM